MNKSKKELFTEDERVLADFAKALSHPARIRILKILLKDNVCMCGDIVDLLPLSQSTVSQHLKELKIAGLITGEVEGPKVCYCLNGKVLSKADKLINNLFSKLKTCC